MQDKQKIDLPLLEKVAKNARLRLTDAEKKAFLSQMQEILNAFSVLDNLDVSKEKPSFQPLEIKNVWRDDAVGKCLSNEDALSNTPHKKEGYFKGPKVIL